jgi:glycosyltransferase involved in cell wall biosynthesis
MTPPTPQNFAGPRFSVLTPVYNPSPKVLREMIASVIAQDFTDWELILIDDGSVTEIAAICDEAARQDSRVRVAHRPATGGIVAASNDALAMATGEFCVLVDHDDLLEPDALAQVFAAAQMYPDMDYCYSDEDLWSPNGHPYQPFTKPAWSPERLRSQNYCSHLSVLRRELMLTVGGFRDEFEGSQDHDLILRVTEQARRVVHIPEVLYHWRVGAQSVAAGHNEAKQYAFEAGRAAVADHCARIGWDATVKMTADQGVYRIRRAVPDVLTSIIIPTRGLSSVVWGVERVHLIEAIASVVAHTTRRIEFVIVADSVTSDVVLSAARRAAHPYPIRIIPFEGPFNFSAKVNLGALYASGELLLLLNDDVDVITEEFLDPMIPYALDADVGAVGAKLLFADGRLQHGGQVYNHNPRHAYWGWPGDTEGLGMMMRVTRECGGVTAACLLTRAEVFHEMGGFCADLPSNFNDVDFNLKLAAAHYRRIWTPHTELYHFESVSRALAAVDKATTRDDAFLRGRWGQRLVNDPYYHPHLAPDRDDWVPADWVTGQ